MKIINVPKVLREKLGDEGVEALLQVLNLSNEDLKKDVITLAEKKFEKRLVEEISKLRVEMGEKLSEMRSEFSEEISKLRVEFSEKIAEVDKRISSTYANIIKWMFIFWIGQIGAILGILFAFFR